MSLKQQFSDIGYSSNREVAKLLGISAGTVSLAFNGKSPNTQIKMNAYLASIAEVVEVAEVAEVAETVETVEVSEVVETVEVVEATEVATEITADMVVCYTTDKLSSDSVTSKESFCLLALLTGYTTLQLRQLLKFWCLSAGEVTFKYQPVAALCSQNELRRLLQLCEGVSFELTNPSSFLYATKQNLVKDILLHYNSRTVLSLQRMPKKLARTEVRAHYVSL
jgi:predicted transcriptional regulator